MKRLGLNSVPGSGSDWIHKEDIQREMRKKIKGVLRDSNYEFEEIEEMTPKIMDLARARLQK